MEIIGLSHLLAPVTRDAFFDSYWPGQPLFVPASESKTKKLGALLNLPELQDVDSLVGARSLKVRACLPDYDDEYSSVLLEPADAPKAYRNNMTLVFDSMQAQNALIASTLEMLRADLGLLAGDERNLTHSRSIAYATPAGGRTRLHFDANANFVLQVKGSKRWHLAANTSVINPTDRYTSCTGEIPAALEKQCHDMLMDSLPDDSVEFLLEPGCVLFVPRGYWHATTTDDDSLSLNFTFSQPTWAEVFAKSIHAHLLQSAHWRELADGLGGRDAVRKQAAIARFESLLGELTEELPKLSGETLLTDAQLLDEESPRFPK